MIMSREKKIWLFAVSASVLFHALFFVCNLSFQSKNMQLPIVVRLVEKQAGSSFQPEVMKRERVKDSSPKKVFPAPQKISVQKEKPRPVVDNTPLNRTETTEHITEKENVAPVAASNSLNSVQGTKQGAVSEGEVSGNAKQDGKQDAGATAKNVHSSGSRPTEIIDVTALIVTRKVTPQYPAFSRKRREEGTVQLLITIIDNAVTECKIEKSSGYARLDEAARRAVVQWKFSHDGAVKARVPVMFKISD